MRISDWSSDVCSSDLPGIVWIEGALDLPGSLGRLVEGADAVIHVAGVINARNEAGFIAGNVAGTASMIAAAAAADVRSEEHTSELQSLMRISYAVFCLKKKNNTTTTNNNTSRNNTQRTR